MRRQDQRDAELVRRYWEYQRLWSAAEQRGANPGEVRYAHRLVEAWTRVDERMRNGGPRAWQLVYRLAALAHGRDELWLLGAGALEDLVRNDFTGAFVERIEAATAVDPAFAAALCNIWMTEGVPTAVRERLAAIGARDFVAEAAMAPDQLEEHFAGRTAKGWDRPDDRVAESGFRAQSEA